MSNNLSFLQDNIVPLTNKQKRHRVLIKIENIFKIDLSKKHYKLIK